MSSVDELHSLASELIVQHLSLLPAAIAGFEEPSLRVLSRFWVGQVGLYPTIQNWFWPLYLWLYPTIQNWLWRL